MKKLIAVILLAISCFSYAQEKLTVEKIMRDPKWMGTSPSNPYWTANGKYLVFSWNPSGAASDSLYYISVDELQPQKTDFNFREQNPRNSSWQYNSDKTAYVFSDKGDIYFADLKSKKTRRITSTIEQEINPQFSFSDKKVVFTSNGNLFTWEIATGEFAQLTNFQSGSGSSISTVASTFNRGNRGSANTRISGNMQDTYLRNDALENSEVLQSRKAKRSETDSMRKLYPESKILRTINIDDASVFGAAINSKGNFITYRLIRSATGGKPTIVPAYVTESGYTEDIQGRTKVGTPQGAQELFVYDLSHDTVLAVRTDSIPGIRDLPDYLKDYPKQLEMRTKNSLVRGVNFSSPSWSPEGNYAVVDIRSQDNKDRWLMLLDPETAKLKLLDRQHDDAWIGGPGTSSFGGNNSGWIDENTFWFQSEASGYSHLYTVNVQTGEKKALTGGKFEVQQAQLSKDKKYFFIVTNAIHPGEQQYYRLSVNGGNAERITTMTGANQVSVSPDERTIAILYSYTNKPWELYLQENKPGGKLRQVTNKAQSQEFMKYAWKDPEVITITARDGASVYARLYKPANPHPSKPAVIFVHGAGYLQNAHKWWSSYFREYMFNNMLVDDGYYVLDIDYRGSAGYGRDWRTGIYRYMGGKDLTDQVDAAEYLVKNFGVDPARIGIYGGSYGGFITLMAMFTTPGKFAAGAALRPVTDWAHYNHGYTSNILNEPYNDSIAYHRSSPIYFAEGLQGNLLICHGMIDVNVHFQDAVRLTQRLIELGKDNWQIAPYPLEDHGFVEPSSWTDEYKRIYHLFETVLKK